MKNVNSLAAKTAACALICAHDLGMVVKYALAVAYFLNKAVVLESGFDALRVHPDGEVELDHGATRWVPLRDSYHEPPKGGWRVAMPSEEAVYGLADKPLPKHPQPRHEGCYTATGCGGQMPSSILRR